MTRQSRGSDPRLARELLCPCGSGKRRERCCGPAGAPAASNPSTASRLVQRALSHHQKGQLSEAEELYAQILKAEPENADALHFSGLLAHQRGQTDIAVGLMMRAMELEPGRAEFHLNLGHVLEARGESGDAIASYRKAVSLDPGLHAAHCRLGDALLKQRRFNEAAASYSQALAIKPDSPETINSMGSLLQKIGRPERSLVCYQKAISLEPNYAEAHNNLGTALQDLGRLEEAIAACKQALVHKPTLAGAHTNLGNMLIARGDFAQAIESLHRATELQPDLVEAHLNMGNALRGQGRLEEAILCYRHAISIAPENADAYNNLAETYKDQDKLDEAIATFRKALAVRPDFALAHSNLLYLYAFTRCIPPPAERVLAEGWEKSVLSEAERAAARQRASAGSGAFPGRSRQGRQLRLGIVSAELGAHAVADFLEPFLEQLDRSRFHLTLFPTYRRFGARAQHFRELADSYIPLMELPDGEAADRIRAEQIDVLMDTTGHTFGDRLGIFAHRAAPVQCTYIGYWSTTGLTEMDWFFGDPYFKAAMDAHFTEGIWRLPRFGSCYRGDFALPASAWAPDPGGTIWLGSFNKYCKIREETLGLWARVLCALPEAKLLLEDRADCEEETHQRILDALAGHGVSPERVEFVPFIREHDRHMALYDRLDIALDTIPFNSGTTAFDALWMGAPLVALEGNWTGGTIASSALKAMGRPEWVAEDSEQFVAIVLELAGDVEGRKRLRQGQRARMAASPLCDAKGLASALQEAFESMYDRWMDGADPHRPAADWMQ